MCTESNSVDLQEPITKIVINTTHEWSTTLEKQLQHLFEIVTIKDKPRLILHMWYYYSKCHFVNNKRTAMTFRARWFYQSLIPPFPSNLECQRFKSVYDFIPKAFTLKVTHLIKFTTPWTNLHECWMRSLIKVNNKVSIMNIMTLMEFKDAKEYFNTISVNEPSLLMKSQDFNLKNRLLSEYSQQYYLRQLRNLVSHWNYSIYTTLRNDIQTLSTQIVQIETKLLQIYDMSLLPSHLNSNTYLGKDYCGSLLPHTLLKAVKTELKRYCWTSIHECVLNEKQLSYVDAKEKINSLQFIILPATMRFCDFTFRHKLNQLKAHELLQKALEIQSTGDIDKLEMLFNLYSDFNGLSLIKTPNLPSITE